MNDKKQIKLHLWCGKKYIPGYIHIDVLDFDHIDYKTDISKLDMFEDNSVDVVYSCHVLEHFERKQVLNVLKERNRVLKPGWICRISVPWFDECIKIYQKYNDINLIIWPIIWGQRDIYDFHKMLFNFDNISSLSKNAWFSKIERYDRRKTEHADVDDYSQAYIPHMDKENWLPVSLNIELTK